MKKNKENDERSTYPDERKINKNFLNIVLRRKQKTQLKNNNNIRTQLAQIFLHIKTKQKNFLIAKKTFNEKILRNIFGTRFL